MNVVVASLGVTIALLVQVYMAQPYVWIRGIDHERHRVYTTWVPQEAAATMCEQVASDVDMSNDEAVAAAKARLEDRKRKVQGVLSARECV